MPRHPHASPDAIRAPILPLGLDPAIVEHDRNLESTMSRFYVQRLKDDRTDHEWLGPVYLEGRRLWGKQTERFSFKHREHADNAVAKYGGKVVEE